MKPRIHTTLPARQRPTSPDRRPVGGWARVRHAAAELTPDAIEQIAHRVAELLRDQAPARSTPPGLLNASELARHLGVTRTWVYEHANQLGAITLGDGPRPRLRFDPETATQALHAQRQTPTRPPTKPDSPRPGRPRRRPTSTVPLLPVHEPRGTRRILSRLVLSRRSRH